MRILALSVLCAISATAQVNPPIPRLFPEPLKQYFELTEEQIAKITELNSQTNSYRLEKLQRQIALQVQITQETVKESPDPFLIGSKYVEVETIRRDLANEQKKVVGRVQELLTVEQKNKISALQQAIQIYPTACSAIDQNFMTVSYAVRDPFPGNIILSNRFAGISGTLLGSGPCASTGFAVNPFVTGDFSLTPPATQP